MPAAGRKPHEACEQADWNGERQVREARRQGVPGQGRRAHRIQHDQAVPVFLREQSQIERDVERQQHGNGPPRRERHEPKA